MTPTAKRLKDVLLTLRRYYGMEHDLDRIIRFVATDNGIENRECDDLFASHPIRTPEDFRAVLLARIRDIIRCYWAYLATGKNRHLVLGEIRFLEMLAGEAHSGCKRYRIVPDKIVGHKLELKD